MTESNINYQLELIKNAEKATTYLICGWRVHQVAAYNQALRCYKKGLEISRTTQNYGVRKD